MSQYAKCDCCGKKLPVPPNGRIGGWGRLEYNSEFNTISTVPRSMNKDLCHVCFGSVTDHIDKLSRVEQT
jgi:hypothetical protein